ncbi:MAG: B12-binding domain-containing radical SAM protein, partial [Nitrospinota bacterium]
MKTLFIYPGITGIGYNSFGYCRDSGNITGTAIPLGIGYLASALEQAGFEADVLDLRHCKGKQEAEEIISKSEADIVAISVQTPSFHHAVELAVISKKYNKTVVAGGIHATVLPEDFIKTGVFDHVIRGEGEFSLVELVQNLESGRPSPSIIQGIWVTEMDMFPMAKDFPVYREIYRSVHNVEFGRGCPAKCTYRV